MTSGANVIICPTTQAGLLYLANELSNPVDIRRAMLPHRRVQRKLYLDMQAAGGSVAEQAG